ncbi:MAG: dTMP kinase [Eubacteriales bacterium]
MSKGLFITFEGLDGAGKSTQIQKVKEIFEQKGFEVVLTREPGGTEISEKIRKIILDNDNDEMSFVTEALLYAASRAQHVSQKIRPALDAGKVVICDRYVHSSIAYQGYGRGLGAEKVMDINSHAIDGLMPDISFFILLPTDKAMERLKSSNRELDRLEVEEADFFQKVETGYLKIADKFDNIIKIDASKSVDEIADIISKKIIYEINNMTQKG